MNLFYIDWHDMDSDLSAHVWADTAIDAVVTHAMEHNLVWLEDDLEDLDKVLQDYIDAIVFVTKIPSHSIELQSRGMFFHSDHQVLLDDGDVKRALLKALQQAQQDWEEGNV